MGAVKFQKVESFGSCIVVTVIGNEAKQVYSSQVVEKFGAEKFGTDGEDTDWFAVKGAGILIGIKTTTI